MTLLKYILHPQIIQCSKPKIINLIVPYLIYFFIIILYIPFISIMARLVNIEHISPKGYDFTIILMIGASLTETSEEQYFVDLDTRLNAHAKTIEGYYYELVKGIEYTDGTGFYDLLK